MTGRFTVRTVTSGLKFDLKAPNGQTILTSEVYETAAACQRGIASVRKNAPAAPVEANTMAAFVSTSEAVKVSAPIVPVENDTHQPGDILLWVVVAAAIAVAITAGALFVIDYKKHHGKH